MAAAYWVFTFVGLLGLHYLVLPKVAPAPLGDGFASEGSTAERPRMSYCIWAGTIATTVIIAMAVSWLAWQRMGYVGTLFYLASGFIWAFRWFQDMERDPAEIRRYDARVEATLIGCVLGSVVAWVALHG